MFPKAYMGSRQVLRLPPAVPKQTCEVNFLPYLDMYAGLSSLSLWCCSGLPTYLLQIICILQLIFGLY